MNAPLNELHRDIAFHIAHLTSRVGRLDDSVSKEDFLIGCALYFDNKNDLETAASATQRGLDQFKHDKESHFVAAAITCSRNPALPASVREKLTDQLLTLFTPKPTPKRSRESSELTNVYLMLNTRNGFIKLGSSDNPKHRESTLQSEEPEVELIRQWPGTIHDELILHGRFKTSRVRGEWFRLSNEDIAIIDLYFQDRTSTEGIMA